MGIARILRNRRWFITRTLLVASLFVCVALGYRFAVPRRPPDENPLRGRFEDVTRMEAVNADVNDCSPVPSADGQGMDVLRTSQQANTNLCTQEAFSGDVTVRLRGSLRGCNPGTIGVTDPTDDALHCCDYPPCHP